MQKMTQQVNFRTDPETYNKANEILANSDLTISDILNVTIKKISSGAIDPVNYYYNNNLEVTDELLKQHLRT